ncbi:hypothetical protein [Desulfonema ishimotonii]|nr:hypothetical protein [Desulfonema ishimotonii]
MVTPGMIQSAGKEMGLFIPWDVALGMVLCVAGKILMGESLENAVLSCWK